jgi:biotin-(acetyl-CoA carboxylase) ligase
MTLFDAPRDPIFPPMMWGEAVTGASNPTDIAHARAALGCDAGLVVYNLQSDRFRAAMVLTPEEPLARAMAMLPLGGVAFQNALGALAPPEVAVHLHWDGGVRVNAARCGALAISASTDDPAQVPDWLIISLDVPLMLMTTQPGEIPDETALFEEGCADVSSVQLLESWTRHMLSWINRWMDGGNQALHVDWMALAQGVGDPIDLGGYHGTYLGVDENFGMLIRDAETTHLLPLTYLLGDTL